DLAFRRFLDAALARAQMLFQHAFQRVARDLLLGDEALRAAVLVGDDDCRAPRGALLVEGFENVETQGFVTPPSPRTPGWCHRTTARPSRRPRRRPRTPASSACRSRSRPSLRSPPRPRR